jgi:hypothetical protein
MWIDRAVGFPTAPQGKVTQPSHKYVTRQYIPSHKATKGLNLGEAD